MAKVKYQGGVAMKRKENDGNDPRPAGTLLRLAGDDAPRWVEHGETVEVPEEVAAELVATGAWGRADKKTKEGE